jgi:raffinose/stachyose/melibiose transport system substrate-binding protein
MKRILIAVAFVAFIGTLAWSKPVTIVFGVGNADPRRLEPGFSAAADAYAKLHPDVKFEYSGAENAEYEKKLEIMINSGDIAYDIFWHEYSTLPTLVEKGALADITPYIDDTFKNYFLPGANQSVTLDGKWYGVPVTSGIMGWFMNKALFDKAGVAIPETFDQWLAAIKALKAKGILPISMSSKENWAVWGYNLFPWYFGWDQMRYDIAVKKTVKFNNPNFIKALGKLEQLAKAGAFPKNMTTIGHTQALETFLAGKAAIFSTGQWEIPAMDNSPIAKDIVFSFGPTFADQKEPGKKYGFKQYNTGYYVSSTAAKDKDKLAAIIDFLKFRSSPEGTRIIAEAGIIPPTRSQGAVKMGPVMTKAVAALADKSVIGVQNETEMDIVILAKTDNDIYVTWCDQLNGILNGLSTPGKMADAMDKTFDRYR